MYHRKPTLFEDLHINQPKFTIKDGFGFGSYYDLSLELVKDDDCIYATADILIDSVTEYYFTGSTTEDPNFSASSNPPSRYTLGLQKENGAQMPTYNILLMVAPTNGPCYFMIDIIKPAGIAFSIPALREQSEPKVRISNRERINRVIGSFINFGGDESNIFNDRSYFNLNGESTSKTSSSINYDNTFICPCDCKIESISFIKRNDPLSSIQIVINQVVNELHVFDLLGKGDVVDADIQLLKGDTVNLVFRNTNGTSGFSRYTLYLVSAVSATPTSTANPITLNFDENNLIPPSKSLQDRIEELEERLNELTN